MRVFFYCGENVLIPVAAGGKIIESERGQHSCTLKVKDTQLVFDRFLCTYTDIHSSMQTSTQTKGYTVLLLAWLTISIRISSGIPGGDNKIFTLQYYTVNP